MSARARYGSAEGAELYLHFSVKDTHLFPGEAGMRCQGIKRANVKIPAGDDPVHKFERARLVGSVTGS